LISLNSNEPVAASSVNMPMITPKSPMRLTMNAFFPAAA
jgi:hypothetical protein